MELIVDRLEEEYIVCEDENKNIVNILKDEVEDEVKEGDILIFVDGKYIVNKEKTKDRKEYIQEKRSSIIINKMFFFFCFFYFFNYFF